MSNARDELATAIMHHPWLPDHEGLYSGLCPECPGRKISGGHNSPSHADHLADAVLAAGYRKPRTITTAEELDALPNGSVIRDKFNDVSERRDGYWCGYETAPLSDQLVKKYLPATVLYEPEAQS